MLWRIVFWPNSGSHLHVNIRVSQSTWEFCPWRVRNWQPLPFLASRHTSTILITPFHLTISPLSRLCDLYLADSGVFVFTFCVLSMLWIYINISRTWFTVRYLIDCVISSNHFRHINIINDNIYIYIYCQLTLNHHQIKLFFSVMEIWYWVSFGKQNTCIKIIHSAQVEWEVRENTMIHLGNMWCTTCTSRHVRMRITTIVIYFAGHKFRVTPPN